MATFLFAPRFLLCPRLGAFFAVLAEVFLVFFVSLDTRSQLHARDSTHHCVGCLVDLPRPQKIFLENCVILRLAKKANAYPIQQRTAGL